MGIINVDEIKSGMVLGSNLFGPNGRFILAEGTILEDKHLQVFKTWGITQADIENISQCDVAELQLNKYGTEIIVRSRQLVSQRFAATNREHEAMAELYRLAVLRTAELLQNNPDEAYRLNSIPEIQELPETPLPQLNISDVISANVQFASLPDTFIKVSEAINDFRSSSTYIAKVISADIGLSAKLLKLVNSAFYGVPQKIESLSQAVTLIGTRQLGSLAQGIALIEHFKGISSTVIDMQSFWHHSISCGVIARLISDMHKMNNSAPFWIAGLLHDIGRLVILQDHPVYVTAVLVQALKEQTTSDVLEPALLGFSHAKIAGLLFEQWNFSPTIESAVKYHHAPHEAQSKIEPAIIHLADIIAHGMAEGKSGNPYVPPLAPSAWETLGISKNDLATIIIQADYQINTLMDIFMS